MAYNRSPLRAAGHAAGAAGAYRLGHVLRGGAAISESLGIESMAASIGVASVAIVALGASVAALKIGLDALSTTATSLVGAISQLGGAKGLQQMIVESVTNQQLINQARFTVTADQRLSSSELNTLGNRLSEDLTAGAFSKEDYLKGIQQIGTETGLQKGLSQDTLGFIGRFAKVGGMEFEESASIFSRMKKQNLSLSDARIEEMMLAGHAIGQAGSFNIQELPDAAKLLQLQGRLGETGPQAMQDLLMAGTLLKAGGAGNLEMAGTQMNAFLKAVEDRGAAGPFKLDSNRHITNFGDSLSYLVNTQGNQLDKHLMAGRSADFVNNIRSAVNQRAGVDETDFSPEAKSKRQAIIDDMEKMHMSMADLNKEYEESLTPQEHFRIAFNKISNNLEAQFLPVLQKMEPVIDLLAYQIQTHSDEIGQYFTKMVSWFAVLVQHLPELATVVKSLATGIGYALSFIVSLLPGHSSNVEEARDKVKNLTETIARQQDIVNRAPGAVIIRDQLEENKKRLAVAQDEVKAFEARTRLSETDWDKEATAKSKDITTELENKLAEQAKKHEEDLAKEAPLVKHSVPATIPHGTGIDTSAILKELQKGNHIGGAHLDVSRDIHQAVMGTPAAPTTSSNG